MNFGLRFYFNILYIIVPLSFILFHWGRTYDSPYPFSIKTKFRYCDFLASKASRIYGAVRKAFQSSSKKLQWPAFRCYVSSILTYCASAWNSNVCHDIAILETVQGCFTKKISSLKSMPYSDRLNELGALFL